MDGDDCAEIVDCSSHFIIVKCCCTFRGSDACECFSYGLRVIVTKCNKDSFELSNK